MKTCPRCGSSNVIHITSTFGAGRIFQSIQCNDCSVAKIKKTVVEKPDDLGFSLLREARTLLVRSISKPATNEDDVAKWLSKFDEWWDDER